MATKMLAALAASADASWPEVPHVRFAIASAKVPACLDLSDPTAWYGSLLQVWDCDPSTPKRRWFFRDGAIVHRTSGGSEFCLDVPADESGSIVNGQQLQLHSCTGKPRQQFKYTNGMLRSRLPGKCLDLHSKDDLAVQIQDCNEHELGQRWQLTMLPEVAGPTLTITAKASGSCLTTTASLQSLPEANGTLLQVWDCDEVKGGFAESWIFNGKRILHHKASDGWSFTGGGELCLDIPDNLRENGQRLQVLSCNGSPQQEFLHQGGAIRTTDGTHCLDVQVEDGHAVQLWECGEDENQQWALAVAPELEPPTVALYNTASRSCLDLSPFDEAVARNGTWAQVWSCDAARASTQWLLGNGAVMHRTHSGKKLCLEVPKNSRSNGQRLRVSSCDDSEQQQFILEGSQLKTTDLSKCVDIEREDGLSVQLWDCDVEAGNQLWMAMPLQADVLV